MSDDMAQYVADTLSSQLAADSNTSDFILGVDENRIAYVDVEDGSVWLLTVERAEFVVAASSSVADPDPKEHE